MKRNLTIAAIAIMAVSCAKSEKAEPYASEEVFFNAWMEVRHPDAVPTSLGAYILEDVESGGEVYDADKQPYVFVRYTVTDLEGSVTSTNVERIAQQVGIYDKSYYYGPAVWIVAEDILPAGVEDMLRGMSIGGRRKAAIPAWLMTTKRYSNASEYLRHKDKESSYANSIYEVELVASTSDILKSEVDSLEKFTHKYLDGVDSLSYGFYYKQLKEPTDTNAFPSDTTVYINYTGRLLNGQVFDTTIQDTAKFYNVYSSSRTYEPVAVNWGEHYYDLTMGDSSSATSVITGFQLTLWEMRHYEKGVGLFYSPYGYTYSGSGKRIPSFAPLIFEIEIVDEPED